MLQAHLHDPGAACALEFFHKHPVLPWQDKGDGEEAVCSGLAGLVLQMHHAMQSRGMLVLVTNAIIIAAVLDAVETLQLRCSMPSHKVCTLSRAAHTSASRASSS